MADNEEHPPEHHPEGSEEEVEEEVEGHDHEPEAPEPPVQEAPKLEPPQTPPSPPEQKGGPGGRKGPRTRRAKGPVTAQNANSSPPAKEAKSPPTKRDVEGSPKKEKKTLSSPPSTNPEDSEEEYEPSAIMVTLCCALESVWNTILTVSRCAYHTTRTTLRVTKKFLPTIIGLVLFHTIVWGLMGYVLTEPDISLVGSQNARSAFTVLSLTYTLWPAALALFVCQWWGDVDQQRFLYESFQEGALLWMNGIVFYHYAEPEDMFWLRAVLMLTGIFRMFHWLSLRYCGVWCQRMTAAPTLNIIWLTLNNLYNVGGYDLGFLHQPVAQPEDVEPNQPAEAPGWF